MKMQTVSSLALASLLFTAACGTAGEPEDATGVSEAFMRALNARSAQGTELNGTPFRGLPCPTNGCGGNGTKLNAISLDGAELEGLQIAGSQMSVTVTDTSEVLT